MHTPVQKTLLALVAFLFLFGTGTTPLRAATDLEISGWIPYWSKTDGIKDAKKHLSQLSMIHPFGYAVKNDGELLDLADIKKKGWRDLFRSASRKDVLIVPTMMWSNTTAMFNVLSNPVQRASHIDAIVEEVKDRKFDGVDINYEGKSSATKEYFSLFLKELKEALGKKLLLSCTIEARTPPESLYVTVPAVIPYANDLDEIAKHCDRINIMAYDQQRADLDLNKERKGTPYVPVADADWVRKVLELMLETVPAEKVSLGVATYGHEFEVITEPDWYRVYSKVRALNIPAIENIVKKNNAKPLRNSAGELGASYFPNTYAPQLSVKGSTVAEQTLTYANQTGMSGVFYYISWSDAAAIAEKVKLAEEFNLNGIAMFKIDGQEDKNIWKLF